MSPAEAVVRSVLAALPHAKGGPPWMRRAIASEELGVILDLAVDTTEPNSPERETAIDLSREARAELQRPPEDLVDVLMMWLERPGRSGLADAVQACVDAIDTIAVGNTDPADMVTIAEEAHERMRRALAAFER